MGDLKPAIEQHEVLYQVVEKHHFLPEAFTADFQVSVLYHLYFRFFFVLIHCSNGAISKYFERLVCL